MLALIGYCLPVFPIGVAGWDVLSASPDSKRKSPALTPVAVALNTPFANVTFFQLTVVTALSVPNSHQPTSVRWFMSQGSWNARVAKSFAAFTALTPVPWVLGAVTVNCAA